MKSQRKLLALTLIVAAVSGVVFLASSEQSVFATDRPNPPTPAPTATPGNPPLSPTSIPLAKPLETEEQALEQALYYDAAWPVWSRPWSKDTLNSEPGRITIEAYPSRTAESAAHGSNEGLAPELEADAGAVWSITISGDVHVAVLSPRAGSSDIVYDGVTYVISKRTGNLLEIRTGPPK